MAREKWTEAQIETLKQLHSEGLSSSHIAARLGPGFTRNAVIGKVHRMHLARPKLSGVHYTILKPAAAPKVPPQKQRSPSMPTIAKAPPVRAVVLMAPAATLFDNLAVLLLGNDTCRYPIGDVGEPGFGFCGHPPLEGRSYCAYHWQLCHARMSVSQQRRERKFAILHGGVT